MNIVYSTNRKFKGSPARSLLICALLVIVLSNVSFSARAAQSNSMPVLPLLSGGLDTTFSGDGRLATNFVAGQEAIARGVAFQSNGRIVVVGETKKSDTSRDFALARYTASGALDPTFNSTGKKVISIAANDQGLGLAIQPADGKIVVVGSACSSDWALCDAVVMRFNTNGSFDNTFNRNGKVVTDFGGADNVALAVTIQPDSKIVSVGAKGSGTNASYDFAILRYTATGALDTTFSGDGKQSIAFGVGRLDEGRQVAIQPDGKIVIAGKTCDSNYANCHFALARLNANGSLDTTFNTTGKQITSFGASEAVMGMALQTDGKIVLSGFKETGTTSYFALARYNTNGSLDTTFAGTGKKVINFSGDAKADSGTALRIQPDGKLVVCGDVSNGTSNDIALVRLKGNGALDPTFSGDGKTTVDFGQDDHCWTLGLQRDGKYLPVGYSDNGVLRKWIVMRVLP